jgi:hypothetical protein
MNLSKAQVALVSHLDEGKEGTEMTTEARNVKSSLELISLMLTNRVFPQSNSNQKEPVPKLAISGEMLTRAVNQSLGKCYRAVELLLSKLDRSDSAIGDLSYLVHGLDAALVECDDLLAWCVKEAHQATLPLPDISVTAGLDARSDKKRKYETISTDSSPRHCDISTWCQDLAAAYPHLSFLSTDQRDILSSGLHLVRSSTANSVDFHFHLSFDLSFTPLRASVLAHRRDVQSPLPSLITPFSPQMSRNVSHRAALHELDREINTLIQSHRLSSLPHNEGSSSTSLESHLPLIERVILCFSQGVSSSA